MTTTTPANEAGTERGRPRDRTTLDPEQRAVVDHGSGPLLVLGGPGTGKTTVLEERFVRLATSGETSADRILFLVPNRAQKMALQGRLTRRLLFDEGLDAVIEVPVYTWHGLAHHLVSRHYDRLAYSEPPVLLTSPEQWTAVREALAQEDRGNWPHHGHLLSNRGFTDEVVDFIIRCEQRLLEEPDLDRIVEARPGWAELVRFFKAQRDQMRAASRVDYPTLLRDAAWLIAEHDEVREALHRRFTHVLVDDGQELATVQQRLLVFLTGFQEGDPGERSLVLAGDPDSAIEHFRGADPAWLAGFSQELGRHDTIILPTTYRLGPDLYGRVGEFISQNGPASHRPQACAGATELDAHRYQSLASEVEAVARALRAEHLSSGVAYDDMAILLTSPRSMLPALERALTAVEVPYSVSAPDRPLEREGVVHTFTELARYAYEGAEDERLADLLLSPLIGLSTTEVRELERAAQAESLSLCDYIEPRPAPEGVAHLLELRDALRAARNAPADEAFWRVWTKARYYRGLEQRSHEDVNDPANRDLDALVVFSRALGRFVERRRGKGTLEDYLEAISRADFGADPWLPPERSGAGVEILSFHAAKGREWEIVAVCGAVEGAIPKGRRAQGLFDPYFLDEAGALERLERNEAEDRRVFYVALTRARRRCILTTSPGPSRKGTPSRYVAELLDAMPEVDKDAGGAPLTFSEAAAAARRVLADPEAAAPRRLAALAAIKEICDADPACTAAQPHEWWWRWDWSEGGVSINDQSFHEPDMDPSKLRTSYTRLSSYDNCPLQYLFSVVIGLDPEITHHLHFGRWIHEIIEDCEKEPDDDAKRLRRRRLTSPEAVFARYEEVFDASVFPHEAIARQFHNDGRKILQNYIDFMKPGTADLVEHTFTIDVDGTVIKGRIDRVDAKGRNLVVSDYKTSRREIDWNRAKESLQLAIYYKAAKEDETLAKMGHPVSMQLVYPFNVVRGDVSKRCQTPEEAEAVLKGLPAILDGILAEDFAPSPEADCMWCKFKPVCPLWPEGRELQP